MDTVGLIKELEDQLSVLKANRLHLLQAVPEQERTATRKPWMALPDARLAAINVAIAHVEQEIERLSKFDPVAPRRSA